MFLKITQLSIVLRQVAMGWLVVFSLFTVYSVNAASFEVAQEAYDAKDFKTALEVVKPLAKQGDGEAQRLLGILYYRGEGVIQDHTIALDWFLKSAEQGVSQAQFHLGKMYQYGVKEKKKKYKSSIDLMAEIRGGASNPSIFIEEDTSYVGYRFDSWAEDMWLQTIPSPVTDKSASSFWDGRGVWFKEIFYPQTAIKSDKTGDHIEPNIVKDTKRAIYWYTKSAEQNNIKAQNALKLMYLYRADEDAFRSAAKWSKRSVKSGGPKEQFNLAGLYQFGIGVLRNKKKAVHWYNEAANQSYSPAQYALGMMYANGDGIEKNEQLALEYFTRAAEKGLIQAQTNLGVMYCFGIYVTESLERCSYWTSEAFDNGADVAKLWERFSLWDYAE